MKKSKKNNKLLDKKWLQIKYIDEHLSTVEIAKTIGCSQSSVSRALTKYDIKIRKAKEAAISRKRKGFKAPELNDKKWMLKKYVTEKLNSYEIAKIVNSNQKSVIESLKFHNIQRRSYAEAKIESIKKNPIIFKYPLLHNKKWMIQKYVVEKLSSSEIANILGCARSLVLNNLEKIGVKRRSIKESRKLITINSKYPLLNNRDWLYHQYIHDKKGTNEIAKIVGAKACNSVRQALHKFDIPLRCISDGLTCNREKDGLKLSEEAQDVINGSLLGDGYFVCWNRKSDNSYPRFEKTNKNYDHVSFVSKILFGDKFKDRISNELNKINDKTFTYFTLRSYVHKEFKEIDQLWYPKSNGYKKLVPKTLKMNPTVLLHWFMDDGNSYLRQRKYLNPERCYKNSRRKKQVVISFASESFYYEDQLFLVNLIKDNFKIHCCVGKYKAGTGWRIFVKQSSANLFFDIIGECPVPSMRYKWK